MPKNNPFSIIALFFGVLLFCSCTVEPQHSPKKDITPKKKISTLIVMGTDSSGSYKMWDRAIKNACEVVTQLHPGDIAHFRFINEASYLEDCSILYLEIPKFDQLTTANPFDFRTKRRTRIQRFQTNQIKKRAITQLSAIKSRKAQKTDLFGFLAASTDIFTHARHKPYRKILLIASDLQDNVQCNNTGLDLSGVAVAILAFQVSQDPARTRKLKSRWTQYLKKAGAEKVTFIPMDQKFNLKEF